jgi:Na+/alanine symporter
MIKKLLIATLVFIVVMGGLATILPPVMFYVTFFALLLVSGICGIYFDNCPRKMEDGQEYCSPSFNPKDKE